MKELEKIRGRHTELVSVYIPSGSNLQEVASMLREEYSLAQNVKDKTVRKNVMSALEKIIQHLKLFRVTPENGLVIFCGNVSPELGVADIKIWSFEPPEKLRTKIYRCDQVFVLDPLKEMIREKEVYGLIVLDAREANIGLLRGKSLTELKSLESTVPSKTVKGGMCVSEDTLIQLSDGRIIKVKDLEENDSLLVCDLEKCKTREASGIRIFKSKVENGVLIETDYPALSIVVSKDHRIFTLKENSIELKHSSELKPNDFLLCVRKLRVKGKMDLKIKAGTNLRFPKKLGKGLCEFLGYALGKGSVSYGRITLNDKDKLLLETYKSKIKRIFGLNPTIEHRKNKLEIDSLDLIKLIEDNFPGILGAKKYISDCLQVIINNLLAAFIRGLFDAEGYVKSEKVVIGMANEEIIRVLQLLLLRFGIVSSYSEGKKHKIEIIDENSLLNFSKHINFNSVKKSKKLSRMIKERKKAGMNLILIPKPKILTLARKVRMNAKDFSAILHKGFSNLDGDITLARIKSISEIKMANKAFYDISVPKLENFVANGILVHNSQRRYDRLREDALNEFFTKVGEVASKLLLQPELKGIIIGGPGFTKNKFVEGNYLHYQLKKKILGVKDTGYTGEYGLEELVKKSEDLMEKASVVKERELLERFFSELQKSGNVVYGFKETKNALDLGAVDTILISEGFDWVRARFKCSCGFAAERDLPKEKIENQYCDKCKQLLAVEETKDLIDILSEEAKNLGTKVELISTETREGAQFKGLGGIGGFLRYKIS
ncbi:MAG: LAGLIDADG family homing endonuclease [Candidatus Aenigmarchaeota archaeon]|nr:LAGLIDADG family homing endonuclease [Candidatus Aenigmarchaeota archaeon]